jgi:hypothetical protein
VLQPPVDENTAAIYPKKEYDKSCFIISISKIKLYRKWKKNLHTHLFWKGPMRFKNELFDRGYFKIGNGASIRFWEDVWQGDTSFANQYPSLYNITQRNNVLVAYVLLHKGVD